MLRNKLNGKKNININNKRTNSNIVQSKQKKNNFDRIYMNILIYINIFFRIIAASGHDYLR